MDFLKEFIKQTQTGSLKTKDYPKEYLDLKMKVSFGQGSLSRIPWVALRSPDMPVSNGYNPVYLFYKEEGIMILSYGISEKRKPINSWDQNIHKTKTAISNFIDKPWKYGDSYVHKYYEPRIEDDEVFFYRDNEKLSEETLYQESPD